MGACATKSGDLKVKGEAPLVVEDAGAPQLVVVACGEKAPKGGDGVVPAAAETEPVDAGRRRSLSDLLKEEVANRDEVAEKAVIVETVESVSAAATHGAAGETVEEAEAPVQLASVQTEQQTAEEQSGDAKAGQDVGGEAQVVEQESGDAKAGQELGGEAQVVEQESGNAKAGQEVEGDAQVAEEESGDAKAGQELGGEEAQVVEQESGGDAKVGQEVRGEAQVAEEESGDAKVGQEVGGDAQLAEEEIGDAKTGQEVEGKAQVAEEGSGDAKVGQEVGGDAKAVEEEKRVDPDSVQEVAAAAAAPSGEESKVADGASV